MDGGAVIEWARSRFRRTQWDVVLVTATMLVAAAAFVGWRVSTPAECAWLAPDPAAWTAEGVRPQVSAGCPLAAGQLVTWAESGGDTAHLTLARTGGIVELDTTHHQELLRERLSSASWTLVFVVAQFALCAYAFVRKPEDRSAGAALVFAGGLLGSTFVTMLGLPPSAAFTGLPRWLFLASVEATYTAVWGAGLLLAAVFPTPVARSVEQFRNRAAIASAPLVLFLVVAVAVWLGSREFLAWAHYSMAAQSIITVFTLLATIVVIGVRMVRTRGGATDVVARQQLFWVGGSGFAAGMLALAIWMVPQAVTGSPLLPADLIGLPGLLFVFGLGVGMLRFRMFDLEVVLVRTVVYSALTLAVVVVYLSAAALLTGIFVTQWSGAPAVVAAVIVAIVVNPIRVRLQRVVNRIVYRNPDDPYRTLSRVAERLAARDCDFARVAQDVRRALRVPYVAIEPVGSEPVAVGRDVAAGEQRVTIPMTYAQADVGLLVVQTRGRGERFSRGERRLLLDLSRQIAAALHQVALAAELQLSRERLVLAREEERRVIRRALHDDVGPTVAGISLQAETARRLMARDSTDAADAVLATIGRDAMTISRSLRGLSYELRPPALDDRGLVLALRDHAVGMAPVAVHFDTETLTAEGGPLPAAVEVAAFRVAMGAMSNVVEHARAANCWVRLGRGPAALALDVEDDGVGLPEDFRAGVGVMSMRERARELGGDCTIGPRPGGGTHVHAVLPTAVGR